MLSEIEDLSNIVYDIKQNITDSEYKKMMELLSSLHNKKDKKDKEYQRLKYMEGINKTTISNLEYEEKKKRLYMMEKNMLKDYKIDKDNEIFGRLIRNLTKRIKNRSIDIKKYLDTDEAKDINRKKYNHMKKLVNYLDNMVEHYENKKCWAFTKKNKLCKNKGKYKVDYTENIYVCGCHKNQLRKNFQEFDLEVDGVLHKNIYDGRYDKLFYSYNSLGTSIYDKIFDPNKYLTYLGHWINKL